MDKTEAIAVLAALGQTTRLEAFRLLVTQAPEGIAAGELARQLAVPRNTLSTHVTVLAKAGLVEGERRGRSILYRADFERLRATARFLIEDCCGGHPDVCAPLLAGIQSCRDARQAA